MLLTAYLPTARAESIAIPDYSVSISSWAVYDDIFPSNSRLIGQSFLYPRDGNLYGDQFKAEHRDGGFLLAELRNEYTITSMGEPFLKKGEEATIYIDDVIFFGMINAQPVYWGNVGHPYTAFGYVTLEGGDTQYINCEAVYNEITSHYDVSFKIEAKRDIKAFTFTLVGLLAERTSYDITSWDVLSYVGEVEDTNYYVSIDRKTEEQGLIENVIDKITEIKDNITNGFSNLGEKLTSGFSDLKNGISNLFNSIVELPSKLWGLIEDGLKGLFIPDEQYMSEYKDKWDTSLSGKLGAVWEVTHILLESWDSIMAAEETKNITLPAVSIPLPEDNSFTFGPYAVPIVPEGFELLATAVKSAVGIFCTFVFINGLKRRYDDFMEGK